MKSIALGTAAVLLHGALAVNQPYAQCGGSGFSGDITCTSGYVCKVQNDYYSQCQVDTDDAAKTSARTTLVTSAVASSTVAKVAASSTPATPASSAVTCTGTFAPISAASWVAAINPGWNLGNTLDAVQNEGDWNNPPVKAETFDDIKATNYFKGVRIPVTWAYHFTSQSPPWNVNETWLQRVSDVIDMSTSRGLYTLVNVHHDSWVWADLTKTSNYTELEERFYRLWYQIGTKLACKSNLVAFEPINEIPGTTADQGAEINKLNNIFLKAINDAGGFNSQRVVTLVGLGEDGAKTSTFFKKPDAQYKNPYAIQYHYYSPYDFIFSAWGKTTWGSAADIASLENDLALVRGNFTDTPLIIGEHAIEMTTTETAARWRWLDAFMRAAKKYNTATIAWDNGEDGLNRAAHQWRDNVALDIMKNAFKGVANSLPDSTTDASTSQNSSAFIYHKYKDAVTDVSVPFLLNGNTFKSVSVAGKALTSGSDYSVSGSSLIFKSSFLGTMLKSDTAPGSVANITVAFSAGAALVVNVVQWDLPTLASTSSKIAPGADLKIPVTWKGVNRPAAVKALRSDGVYLFDDWTQYLGPLQQARITYNGQWNWDASNVILTSATIDAVKSAGKATTFTFEFYPRVPGNAVNYTLTV